MSNKRTHKARKSRPSAIHFVPDPRWQQHFTWQSRLLEAGKAIGAVALVVFAGLLVWSLIVPVIAMAVK